MNDVKIAANKVLLECVIMCIKMFLTLNIVTLTADTDGPSKTSHIYNASDRQKTCVQSRNNNLKVNNSSDNG